MATVPTFDTFNPGEVVTDVKLNKNIRDAGNFYRLPPSCVLRSSAVQTLATGVESTITMDTVDHDTDSMADLANNRIVIKTAGLYVVGGELVYATNSSGYRRIVIVSNGVNITGQTSGVGASVQLYLSAFTIARFAVNDNILLSAQQASGANLATVTNSKSPSVFATWLAA